MSASEALRESATAGGRDIEPVAQRLKLPGSLPCTIGLGAFLKDTVSIIAGDEAFVSRTVGHTDRPEAVAALGSTALAMIERAGAVPAVVAHDLHPDFPSTRLALELAAELGVPTLAVQHHHAHIAAVMAETRHDMPVIGLALDGLGLGTDRAAWGGELLYCDGPRFQRLGHLSLLKQAGGDVAARETWRMGAAILHKLGRGQEIAARWSHLPAAAMLDAIMQRGLNSPETSSAGRLFDGVSGLLGVCEVATFEGEAPIALEHLVSEPVVMAAGWQISPEGVLDLTPLLARLADEPSPQVGANLFHGTLAAALDEWVVRALDRLDLPVTGVAFAGGCFFNRVLTGDLSRRLGERGLQVLKSERLGPGDPSVSLGQAYVAALGVANNLMD